jgi:hypothetical protein
MTIGKVSYFSFPGFNHGYGIILTLQILYNPEFIPPRNYLKSKNPLFAEFISIHL